MDRRQRMLLLLLGLAALLAGAHCQCQEGWRLFEGRCYFFSTDAKPWLEANTYCLGRNANLMSIQDIHERLWVSTQIDDDIYWIGLNDRVTEGTWEWSDGSPYLEFLAYWRSGQPDNWQGNEHCGQVIGSSNGQWNDDNCNNGNKYICKYLSTNPTPQCDLANGWRQYADNCYKLKADTRKSWTLARHDCVEEGGDLVSITSAGEEQYVTGKLDDSFLDLWIGFSTLICTKLSCQVNAGNDEFRWSDAVNITFTNWGQDEPANNTLVGSCAAIIKEAGDDYGKWKSHVCRHERPYMCKRPLNAICLPGWDGFNGSCYWTVSNTDLLTTWYEAQEKCVSMGAELLIINSQEEQYFINGKLPDFHHVDIPDIWIGLSDKYKDGEFTWMDKRPITFSNFGPGWPRNTVGLWDCGQIFTGNYAGKWETTNCFKLLGYICEMAGGHNVRPTLPPDSHCDPGYLLYGNFCYHFETETVKNWDDAENQCREQQGHLVSFHTPEELSFLTAHMPAEAWVGLNDKENENQFVYSDGTDFNFRPWAPNQPDDWQGNEDCVNLRGMDHIEPGLLNDDFCTSTKEYICKKPKEQGPPPNPPTTGPGWNDKCGSWTPDPFNDYCYLFNYLSMRTWAEARADCINQGGDLISITDPVEQAFIKGVIHAAPTGISLWMGGHDSITEGGWEWTDGSPFRFINWNAGNPDDYYGEDCLSILINSGYWNDDNCDYNRGYICKRRGRTPEPPPPHDGYMTALACQDSSIVLHCPEESVLDIQSAFYGRNSDDICPDIDGSIGEPCTVDGVLPLIRKLCNNRQFCFAYAHMENDPCSNVTKYLQITYSCEQKVCLHGLGVENGTISNSQLSASSSLGSSTPDKARLKGASCWIPSGNPTSSWIQVNLGQPRKVTGIVTQGCPQNDYWVTEYRIQHSMDGTQWSNYMADGPSFPGSVDRDSVNTQLLGTPVSAQYIRIIPLEFNGQAGLRFDILGCTPDYAITCADKPNLNAANEVITVHCPAGCARVNYNVYGTDVYRGDSNICAAAIHAGVVLNEVGGDCTLLKKPGQSFYTGSTRNGIISSQYDESYSVSYEFTDGILRCAGPDWYEFGEFCYKPFGDKKTWHNAVSTCRKLGADLVSILSMTEQSWLESYLYMATSDIWTGLNDLTVQGMFTWSDNHMVTFTYWAPGEPNNHAGFNEDCVEMLHQTGRWDDVPCTELNDYICKKPKGHYPLPSAQPTMYGCPQGWDAYSYSCYWMEETAKTWTEAKSHCKGLNASLLHIGDIYEQSHFTVALSGKSGFWWIGLRAHGGASGGVDYMWDNGLPLTFTHWDQDQPDNGDGTCVAMSAQTVGGFWDDKPCLEKFSFICEKSRPDITPPTLPPTAPPSPHCAEGWTSLGNFRNCYKLFHNVDWSMKKSWGAAREDCLSRGADLVSIHFQNEEEFLSQYSKGSSKWIGLKHNPTEGGYSWSDGTPLSHTNWGFGEPDNYEGREDCVEMVSSISGNYSWWNDLNCDAHQDWICMISKAKDPIVPPTPPPPVPAPDCGTNPGWRKNNRICYYYNDTDIVDFHTAHSRCYAEKARLVSILNKDEQTYVNSMVGTGKIDVAWIGMRMFGIASGQYKWVDGSPVTYTMWRLGEPDNANGEEQCVQMMRQHGVWQDANCGRAVAGYVCKKYPRDAPTPPPPTQPWEGYCPAGWMRYKNKCFIFKGQKNDLKGNWSFARSWCQEQGGNLAVIDESYENSFVASYLRDLEFPAWIGMSDEVQENEFAWADGSPVLYTNWAEKEPDNAGDGEHCVAMTHNHLVTGRWTDDACHLNRSFICYKKKSSSITPPPTQNPCQDGYISWYQNCYKLVEEPATWEEAQKACKKEGANLASIDMSYEQAYVSLMVLKGNADAWIGLSRKDNTTYTWSDGWPVFFTQWGPGEPSNNLDEGCVTMRGQLLAHGTWNDTECDQLKNYICKTTTETPPPTPAPGNGNCRLPFVPYGQYCYFVHNAMVGSSWPDSRHNCLLWDAELASIHSRAEVEFIRNLDKNKYHNLWIGLTRDNNFAWGWTDETSVGFVNWAAGEPSMSHHTGEAPEKCVEMYHDGKWNDNDCLQKRGYVCRRRQDHTTDETVTILPTIPPFIGGAIAGAVIGATLICLALAGLYYVFRVRGYKIKSLSLPTNTSSKVDVPSFTNPNFGGESDI